MSSINANQNSLISFFSSVVYPQSLLDEPNPNNSLAAHLYQENKREYEKRVNYCRAELEGQLTLRCRTQNFVWLEFS